MQHLRGQAHDPPRGRHSDQKGQHRLSEASGQASWMVRRCEQNGSRTRLAREVQYG